MTAWFKAGTRWHIPGAYGRSLCEKYKTTDPQAELGGRPCAGCSRAEVAAQVEAEHAAYLATLGPVQTAPPAPLWIREEIDALRTAEKAANEQKEARRHGRNDL